ncbi:MAG: HNH endonuclease [Planctomycetaceae bacterium]|nr:HNH endonuclease [Planctomycetaceae bacterium]
MPRPPTQLAIGSWEEAYSLFFPKLNGGRPLRVFHSSMKNARDMFDGHHDSGRVGWRESEAERSPQSLPEDAAGVLSDWGERTDEELWNTVSGFADYRTQGMNPADIERLAGTTPSEIAYPFTLPDEVLSLEGLFEGAVRTITVNAFERNQEARRQCIGAHGTDCCICGFSFGAVYGPEAEGLIHVHHLRPLAEIGGEYAVDPVEDLRPVCPNCHAILHLGGRCRTIEEVRQLLEQQRHT